MGERGRRERKPRTPRAPRPTPPGPPSLKGRGEEEPSRAQCASEALSGPTPPGPPSLQGGGETCSLALAGTETAPSSQASRSDAHSPPPCREGGYPVAPKRNRKRKLSLPHPVRPPVPHLISGQSVSEAKAVLLQRLRRVMTLAEVLLWSHLRGNRLGGLHFRRQHLIHGFVADFYCHAAGVVVELDGPVHDAQSEYDAARDRTFAEIGLLVLRFRNDELSANAQAVLDRIFAACTERITAHNPPRPVFLPSLQGGAGGGSSEPTA